MNEYFLNLITKELKQQNKYGIARETEIIYIQLLYIIYLGTLRKEKATLKEIFTEENIENICAKLLERYEIKCIYLKKINFKEILKLMQKQNYKELLIEFLKSKIDTDNNRLEVFTNPKEKVLYLNSDEKIQNYPLYLKNYDYVSETLDEKRKSSLNNYKFINKMLGRKNNYYNNIKEVDINKYDVIIINDTEPYYMYSISNEDNLIKAIRRNFYLSKLFKGRLIFKTNFNKISKFPYRWLIAESLSKVIFHKDNDNINVYMEYLPSNNNSISLILLNEELEKDNEKLKELLSNNRAKKNTLLKIKPEEIINNNYRISFKMYQQENIKKAKEINDIVDENSKKTEDLDYLNQKIAIEVNKLLERKGA